LQRPGTEKADTRFAAAVIQGQLSKVVETLGITFVNELWCYP